MPDAPQSLRALFDVVRSLVRRTATGTLALARVEPLARPGLLHPELRDAVREQLEQARGAAAVPLDAKVVDKALKPFDDVQDEPLAVTPTAQVHAASLDGEPVAVKIARPGVAATVRSELALLDILVAPLRLLFPRTDAAAMIADVREAAMDELDLEHEGETAQRVRRALRRVDGVVVPDVFLDECEPGRLVTARLDGPTLAAGAAPEDPSAVARALVRAHLTAWRDAGLVLTDPRPSHVVLLADGQIGLLGTGLARPVGRDRHDAGVAAFTALSDDDPAAFVAAVGELGVLPEEAASAAHGLLREVLGELVGGGAVRLDDTALLAVGDRAFARIEDLMRLGAQATPEPSDLAVLRMLGQLSVLLAGLGATEDWVALATAAD